MKSRKFLYLIAALVPAAGLVAQISDINPPKLVEFEISPSVIDVSTNDQFITLTARITDDLSGLSFANISFKAPGSDGTPQVVTPRPNSLLSGGPFDGVYGFELFIPAHSRTGTWTVVNFALSDQALNRTNLTVSDLRGPGLPISFTVTGVEDRNPPEIVSLSLEPATIDTSTANGAIAITAHIHEDVSWVAGFDEFGVPLPDPGSVQFMSPSRRQTVSANLLNEQISGDNHDAIFRTTLHLPQFSEPGVWQLLALRLKDSAGNVQSIDLGSALGKGLAAEFTVTGVGDTTAPTLKAFDFSPRRIDAPITNQTVTVTARYVDDLAGFGTEDEFFRPVPTYVTIGFRSPSGRQTVGATLAPVSDFGPLDLQWSDALHFPPFCETGVWTLTQLGTRDEPGNFTQLNAVALRQLGFATEIAVGITPTIRITLQNNAILLSWPVWGEGFHLQSREVDASTWTAVQTQPAIVSDQLVVSIPISPASQLFRLSQ